MQALVGSKTISFWLMDKDMYDKMAINETSQVCPLTTCFSQLARRFRLN